MTACIRARAWMLEPLPSRARPCACTEIGEHLPNLTDNTSISERRIMTQTMAHLLLLVVSSYSAGLVRYRRFGRPCHCFDTVARLGECNMIFLAHTTCILVLYMITQTMARLN